MNSQHVSGTTPSIVEDAVVRVVRAAEDDWVYLAELQYHLVEAASERGVQLWYGTAAQYDEEYDRVTNDPWFGPRLKLGLNVVESLLRNEYMVPGYVMTGFNVWDGTVDEWVERIASGWRELGTSLSLNDVCWFRNTSLGSSLAAMRPMQAE